VKPIEWILTLACVLGIAAGQLLFKRAAELWPQPFSVIGLAKNHWLLIALAIYGIATLGWIYVLRTAPLHLAYPVFALAFLFVPMMSSLFLSQPMQWQQWVGGAIIVVGVIVATRS
jgi:drug/metabolite transporter (DMT)-like permease